MGATASGKAELARAAAREAGALLVSCDSMKVYRGMDVGTAKPPPAERGEWLGLDLVDPWERFDASRFRGVFDDALARARAEGRPLLLSGGTMLYLKAATEGLCEAPPRDEDVRRALAAEAEVAGVGALHERLQAVDPPAAARIHRNDLRRIVRALEVHTVTGRALSDLHAESGGRLREVRPDLRRTVFVVRREREDMDRRIDGRVLRMLELGWTEECERLLADPRGISTEAAQALGYRELFAWLRSGGAGSPPEEVVRRVQTATRRFARRQLTWLRHLDGVEMLDVAPEGRALDVLERVVTSMR
ncbi:MAG: tRNA (adenosine(37)-N6)-dimethylallyltransferase MiaA [Planctomycetes bacterium]|nr:tRNA (adenosine(37)-N6)-dimethylallyltransferase MiaA [Planctomycetota bacterium]